jgi:putative hemin transport protein
MNLEERISELQSAEPRLRARDLAARLAVSEAEVVAARGATRLRPDWDALLRGLAGCGRVMALTRNESVVHERRGRYGPPEGEGPVRLVLGPDIDLRLFLHQWRSGWAVQAGGRSSVQVFDAHGDAVHKVFATEETDLVAWAALLASLADPGPLPAALPRPPRPAERPDADIDTPGFQAAWRTLEDTHAFFPLLRRFGVSRPQAMRLAPPGYADAVGIDALERVLRAAALESTAIMVFVGNPGCIQIHTGPVNRVAPTPGWLNVLDPTFNLHVRVDRLSSAWRVRKPTRDGEVTSLELYDVDGELVAQLFGARKPGVPQSDAWAELVNALG